MNKKHKISTIVPSEKEKEEIKWIKVQRNIAILGIIAAILANSIQYTGKLYNWYSLSKIAIEMEDDYLMNRSFICIYNSNNTVNPIVKAHPIDLKKGTSLVEGSYLVKMEYQNTILFEDYIYLKKHEHKIYKLPNIFGGSFLVFAKINAIHIYPNMPLPLIVESSREGYLWIYELDDKTPPKFIFPKSFKNNEIFAGDQYTLPRKNVEFIKTGSYEGKEKLLFIVTEKNDKGAADKIALNTFKNTLQKADSSLTNINYGITAVSYSIRLFHNN